MNRLSLWRISGDLQDESMDGTGLEAETDKEVRLVCETLHRGDVTGLEVCLQAFPFVTYDRYAVRRFF